MAEYTRGELVRASKRVRGNTVVLAEDIPEDRYGFRATADTRTVGESLVHIAVAPRMQMEIHRRRVLDLADADVPVLFAAMLEEEQEPRTKAEILALLELEGSAFSEFLDALTDEILDEQVIYHDDPFPSRSRLEMLMAVEEHEMHHRAQLTLVQRMLGIVPHLTRRREEQMRADQ